MNVSQKRLFIPLGEEVDYDRFKTVEEVFELVPASSRLTKMRAFPRSILRSSKKKFIRRLGHATCLDFNNRYSAAIQDTKSE